MTNVIVSGSFERVSLVYGRKMNDCETVRHGYELWATKTWLLVTKKNVIKHNSVRSVARVLLPFSCECVHHKQVKCGNPSFL